MSDYILIIICIMIALLGANSMYKEFVDEDGLIKWAKEKLSNRTLANIRFISEFATMILIGLVSAFILDLIFLRLI